MKKIIAILLLSTGLNAQVKLFQIEKSASPGSVLTTTGTPGTLTYTNTLSIGVIPNLPAYTPTVSGGYEPKLNGTGFVKSTGTVVTYDNSTYLTSAGDVTTTATQTLTNKTIGSPTLTGVITTNSTVATSTINGSNWYSSPTTNGFNWYSNDPTVSGYHSVFKNSVHGLGIYMNTSTVTSQQSVQIGSTSNTGFGLFANGGAIVMGINSSSVNIIQPVKIGGSSASPTSSLEVTGGAKITTTLSLGSATTITGVNSGTLAVLTDVYFPLNCVSTIFSPADATTYYLGTIMQTSAPETTANLRIASIPYNCTLVGASINCYSNITSTAESSTVSIRINNTTDVVLSNTVSFSGSSSHTNQTNVTGLSTSINANSTYEIKWLTPTWVTNPANCSMQVTLYFSRR